MKAMQPELQSDYYLPNKSGSGPSKSPQKAAKVSFPQKEAKPATKNKVEVKPPPKKEAAQLLEERPSKKAPARKAKFSKSEEFFQEEEEEEEEEDEDTIPQKFEKPPSKFPQKIAAKAKMEVRKEVFDDDDGNSDDAVEEQTPRRILPAQLARELKQFNPAKLKLITEEPLPTRPFLKTEPEKHGLSRQAYLAAARLALDAGGKEWRRSMFMMVGEGRAGKTAVLNALMGRSFVQTASTIGIEACEVKVTGVKSKWGQWSEYDIKEVKQAELAQAEMASRFLQDPEKRREVEKLHPRTQISPAPAPSPPPSAPSSCSSSSSSSSSSHSSSLSSDLSLSTSATTNTPSPLLHSSRSKYNPFNLLSSFSNSNNTVTKSSTSSSTSSSPSPTTSPTTSLSSTSSSSSASTTAATASNKSTALSSSSSPPPPPPPLRLSQSSSSTSTNEFSSSLPSSASLSTSLSSSSSPSCSSSSSSAPSLSPTDLPSETKVAHVQAAEEELTKKLDQELVVRLMKQGRSTDDSIVFSAWDYGGQEVFYSLHHLFLSRYGVYLVCFNMEWLVPSASAEQVDQCLSYLTFWLNSIAVHTRDSKGNFAPALLVGTHKDVVASPALHEAISNRLFAALEDNQVFRSSVFLHDRGRVATGRGQLWFFPVDNKLGRNDVVVQEVMGAIESIVSAEEYIHQKVPLSWLKVYDSLQVKSRSAPFVSLKDMLVLASECGVPAKVSSQSLEQETRDMLNFFSALGIVMYHDEVGLREVVVLDPAAYLVGPATLIIREHKIHPPPERARRSPSWRKLTKDSLLDANLIPLLWEEVSEEQQQVLVSLLVKFGLLVPLLRESSSSSSSGSAVIVSSASSPSSISPSSSSSFSSASSSTSPSSSSSSSSPSAINTNSSRLYLVPSLLRPPSATDQTHFLQLVPPDATERPLSFRVFFAVDDEVTRLEIMSQTLLTSGFLPNGLFARILGKCVSWGQSTSSFQPRLFKDNAMLCFGEHLFTIESVASEHSVVVNIHPAKINPRLVMERMRELVEEVIRECMPQLVFCLLVGGLGPGHLINLDRLADSIAQGKQIFIDSRKLSTEDVYSQYRIWLPQQGIPDRYDVFVASALHGNDAQLSGKLFHCLSLCDNGVRPIDTFWDRQCLVNGRRVALDAAQALFVSLVAVPLISEEAVLTLHEAAGEQLLFEWVLALELHAAGVIKHIMPLCVDVCGTKKDAILARVAGSPASVGIISHVREFLKSKSITHSRDLETHSIRAVVNQLLSLPNCVDAPAFMAHRHEEWERLPTAFAFIVVSQCVRPAFQLALQEQAKTQSVDAQKAKVLSHEEIDWLEKVGSGIASEVWRCRWHSTEVAVKVMKNQTLENKAEFDKEVEVNTRLPFHERMVPMNGIVLVPKMCIVLKYLPRLSVEDYVIKQHRLSAPSDFASALSITVDASAGIAHLHSEGCVHRDIACRNFLLDEHLRAYVCDFGLSKYLSPGQSAGTGVEGELIPFRWMAPEALLARTYSKSSDVYMFGMFLYELFARNVPFKAELPGGSVTQIRNAVVKGERPILPMHWPKDLKDIIASCWREDPLMRPTMSKVNDKLSALLEHARRHHIKLAPGLPKDLVPLKALRAYDDADLPANNYAGYVQNGGEEEPPPLPSLSRVVSQLRTVSAVEENDTLELNEVFRLPASQLQDWLQLHNLDDIAVVFHQHSVDGALLRRLNPSELLSMGLSAIQCKRLFSKLPTSLEHEVRELRAEVAELKYLLVHQTELLNRLAASITEQPSTYISSLAGSSYSLISPSECSVSASSVPRISSSALDSPS